MYGIAESGSTQKDYDHLIRLAIDSIKQKKERLSTPPSMDPSNLNSSTSSSPQTSKHQPLEPPEKLETPSSRYEEISKAIDQASEMPARSYQAFLSSVENHAKKIKESTKSPIDFKNPIIAPNEFVLKNPSTLEGAWIVKAIVWFGGYSIRLAGNDGHYLSLAQTQFYIEELMKRGDKVELIAQIKSELERVRASLTTTTKKITPYSSFVQNLQLIEPKGKKELVEILQPEEYP